MLPSLLNVSAGGLPYLGASITTVYLAKQAGLAATGIGMDPGYAATLLNEALNLYVAQFDLNIPLLIVLSCSQVTYGAVMLSFLGAMHWYIVSEHDVLRPG